MTIRFACPQCKAQIEVGEELAGHAGQCPRCQNVIVIPDGRQPAPILTPADEPPPPPREDKRRPAEPATRRPRRTQPIPPAPPGPIWPWAVGILAFVVVLGFLISSFVVLAFWRRPVPTPPAPIAIARPPGLNEETRVTAGFLQGKQATMQNGVFQVRSELTRNDPRDLDHELSPAKVFEVQLIANREYAIELDTTQFNSELRIETAGDNVVRTERGNRDFRQARIEFFRPNFTGVHFIHVTTPNQWDIGRFTLTVREQNVAKPMAP